MVGCMCTGEWESGLIEDGPILGLQGAAVCSFFIQTQLIQDNRWVFCHYQDTEVTFIHLCLQIRKE